MPTPRKILIASASAGSGHLRAGEALRQAMQLCEPSWAVEHLDVLTLAPSWVRAAYGGGFELIAARAPGVWREIYRWADGPDEDAARWGVVAERLLFGRFRRLLIHGKWDLCVCTHFLPAQLAAGRRNFAPFALVVTDFTLHRYWAQERVLRYFVATDGLAAGVRARIPRARIDVTGIPISPVFGRWQSHLAARKTLDLDPDRPTAVLLGGGMGLRIEGSVAAVLRGAPEALQLVVICGRNVGAYERLRASGLPARVQVHSYVNDVERFFAAADVVITKPGGLTTSEAVAMAKPLILTRPLPGHEDGNLRTLVDAGVALDGSSAELLAKSMKTMFADPVKYVRRCIAAATIGRPHAAAAIVEALRRELVAEVAA